VKRSGYAEKQGRAPSKLGSPASGRTRYATTSPLSPDYVVNPHHRLAEYWRRGDAEWRALEREGRRFEAES
jgi:hypothetical protein